MISDKETEEHLAELLGVLKERFEAGDKTALLIALHECFLLKKPPPEWLRLAFIAAYQASTAFEIKTWDSVFGTPHPKGIHLEKERRNVELRIEVVAQAEEIKAAGKAVDEGMFETIANRLKIKTSMARELYYDARGKSLRDMFERLRQARDQVTTSRKI
jgi:hypothetical protein